MRPPVRYITKPADWAILASPARLPLVEALRRQPPEDAPFSVRAMAALVGLPPDRLYRHIAKLVKVGVLLEVPAGPARPTPASRGASSSRAGNHRRDGERWYDLTADDFQIAFPDNGSAGREVLIGTANTFLRMAGASIKGASRGGLIKLEAPNRNITMHCDQGLLTAEQFRRIRAVYMEAKAIIDQARDLHAATPPGGIQESGACAEETGQLYLTLMIATPVAPERRGRGRARPAAATASQAPANEPPPRPRQAAVGRKSRGAATDSSSPLGDRP